MNPEVLTTYIGHSSINLTYDLYGRMLPGNEAEAAGLLFAYLKRANTKGRFATLGRDTGSGWNSHL